MPVTAYDALAHSPMDASIYRIDLDGDNGCRFVGGQLYIDGQPISLDISLDQLFVFGIQANTSNLHLGARIFDPGAQRG